MPLLNEETATIIKIHITYISFLKIIAVVINKATFGKIAKGLKAVDCKSTNKSLRRFKSYFFHC